jgi:hypothetical protein
MLGASTGNVVPFFSLQGVGVCCVVPILVLERFVADVGVVVMGWCHP